MRPLTSKESLPNHCPGAGLSALEYNFGDVSSRRSRSAGFQPAMEFGHSTDRTGANPEGIASLSPGLRAERYPGGCAEENPNPVRVVSRPRPVHSDRHAAIFGQDSPPYRLLHQTCMRRTVCVGLNTVKGMRDATLSGLGVLSATVTQGSAWRATLGSVISSLQDGGRGKCPNSSAGFQPAVTRISNPQAPRRINGQPTGSRRYGRLETCATSPYLCPCVLSESGVALYLPPQSKRTAATLAVQPRGALLSLRGSA
jgi:hypothetical protein